MSQKTIPGKNCKIKTLDNCCGTIKPILYYSQLIHLKIKMYKQFLKISFFIILLFLPSLSTAAYTDSDRDLIIQKQMNCMKKQIASTGEIVWEDICSADNVPDMAINNASSSWPEETPSGATEREYYAMDLEEEEKTEFAFSEEYARENTIGIKAQKHQLEMAWEFFRFRYEEPDVMKDSGLMRGVYGLYTYRPGKEDLFCMKAINLYRIEGRHGWGQVDYEAVNAATLDDIDDWAVELRGILGKEYIDGSYNLGITIFSGFGYRYLNDNTSGRTSTVGSTTYYGYQRESNYYYLPLGIEFSGQPNDGWSFMLHGEYDWLIYGLQKSHLSDGNRFISTKNSDIENPQHQGYGLRGSLKITKALDKASFTFEPFVRYWNIADSEVVRAFVDGAYGNYIEPENNTVEAGLKLGVQF